MPNSTRTNEPSGGNAPYSQTFSGENERVIIHREGGVSDSSFSPGEVQVRRVEINRSAEFTQLNQRIAEAKTKILESQRVRRDASILAAEARKMVETSEHNAAQAAKVVELQEQLRRASLAEEQQFEEKRAMAHDRAVNAENSRANAKAEEILFLEQRKEAQKLISKHEAAAEHALKIERAYEMVLAEAEKRRRLLSNDVELQVIGELPQEFPEAAKIRVEVQPQPLPEVTRLAPTNTLKATAKLAEVAEHLPQHPPIHVEPERVEATGYVREEMHTIVANKMEALSGAPTNIEAIARPLTESFERHTTTTPQKSL